MPSFGQDYHRLEEIRGEYQTFLPSQLSYENRCKLLSKQTGDVCYDIDAMLSLVELKLEREQEQLTSIWPNLLEVDCLLPSETAEIVINNDHKNKDHQFYLINLNLFGQIPIASWGKIIGKDADKEVVIAVIRVEKDVVSIFTRHNIQIIGDIPINSLKVFSDQRIILSDEINVTHVDILSSHLLISNEKNEPTKIDTLQVCCQHYCELNINLQVSSLIVKATELRSKKIIEAESKICFVAKYSEHYGEVRAKEKIEVVGDEATFVEGSHVHTPGAFTLQIKSPHLKGKITANDFYSSAYIQDFEGCDIYVARQSVVQAKRYLDASKKSRFVLGGTVRQHCEWTSKYKGFFTYVPGLEMGWRTVYDPRLNDESQPYSRPTFSTQSFSDPIPFLPTNKSSTRGILSKLNSVDVKHDEKQAQHVFLSADLYLNLSGITQIKDATTVFQSGIKIIIDGLIAQTSILDQYTVLLKTGSLEIDGTVKNDTAIQIIADSKFDQIGTLDAKQIAIATKDYKLHEKGKLTADQLQIQAKRNIVTEKGSSITIHQSAIIKAQTVKHYGTIKIDDAAALLLEAEQYIYKRGRIKGGKQAYVAPIFISIGSLEAKQVTVNALLSVIAGLNKCEESCSISSIVNIAPAIALQSLLFPRSVSSFALTLLNISLSVVASTVPGAALVILPVQIGLNALVRLSVTAQMLKPLWDTIQQTRQNPSNANFVRLVTGVSQIAVSLAYTVMTAHSIEQGLQNPTQPVLVPFHFPEITPLITRSLSSALSSFYSSYNNYALVDVEFGALIGLSFNSFNLASFDFGVVLALSRLKSSLFELDANLFDFTLGSNTLLTDIDYCFGNHWSLLDQYSVNARQIYLEPLIPQPYSGWNVQANDIVVLRPTQFNNSSLTAHRLVADADLTGRFITLKADDMVFSALTQFFDSSIFAKNVVVKSDLTSHTTAFNTDYLEFLAQAQFDESSIVSNKLVAKNTLSCTSTVLKINDVLLFAQAQFTAAGCKVDIQQIDIEDQAGVGFYSSIAKIYDAKLAAGTRFTASGCQIDIHNLDIQQADFGIYSCVFSADFVNNDRGRLYFVNSDNVQLQRVVDNGGMQFVLSHANVGEIIVGDNAFLAVDASDITINDLMLAANGHVQIRLSEVAIKNYTDKLTPLARSQTYNFEVEDSHVTVQSQPGLGKAFSQHNSDRNIVIERNNIIEFKPGANRPHFTAAFDSDTGELWYNTPDLLYFGHGQTIYTCVPIGYQARGILVVGKLEVTQSLSLRADHLTMEYAQVFVQGNLQLLVGAKFFAYASTLVGTNIIIKGDHVELIAAVETKKRHRIGLSRHGLTISVKKDEVETPVELIATEGDVVVSAKDDIHAVGVNIDAARNVVLEGHRISFSRPILNHSTSNFSLAAHFDAPLLHLNEFINNLIPLLQAIKQCANSKEDISRIVNSLNLSAQAMEIVDRWIENARSSAPASKNFTDFATGIVRDLASVQATVSCGFSHEKYQTLGSGNITAKGDIDIKADDTVMLENAVALIANNCRITAPHVAVTGATLHAKSTTSSVSVTGSYCLLDGSMKPSLGVSYGESEQWQHVLPQFNGHVVIDSKDVKIDSKKLPVESKTHSVSVSVGLNLNDTDHSPTQLGNSLQVGVNNNGHEEKMTLPIFGLRELQQFRDNLAWLTQPADHHPPHDAAQDFLPDDVTTKIHAAQPAAVKHHSVTALHHHADKTTRTLHADHKDHKFTSSDYLKAVGLGVVKGIAGTVENLEDILELGSEPMPLMAYCVYGEKNKRTPQWICGRFDHAKENMHHQLTVLAKLALHPVATSKQVYAAFKNASGPKKTELASEMVTSFFGPGGFFKVLKIGKVEIYFRGDDTHFDQVFSKGFSAFGEDTDLLTHMKGNDAISRSAYIATSTTRETAIQFPRGLKFSENDIAHSYVYEIHTRRPAINVPKALKGRVEEDDWKTILKENERAVPYKISPEDIKGAWPVETVRAKDPTEFPLRISLDQGDVDYWCYEEISRTIQESYIHNPNFKPANHPKTSVIPYSVGALNGLLFFSHSKPENNSQQQRNTAQMSRSFSIA